MTQLRGVQGLEVFERSIGSIRRHCLPLTRETAAAVRVAFERRSDLERHPVFPSAAQKDLRAIEGLVLRAGDVTCRYVLGAEMAALRRVLVVEAAVGSQEALQTIGMGEWFQPPNADEIDRHDRAIRLLQMAPRTVARWWVDGDTWPPAAEAIERVELEFEAARTDGDESVARRLSRSGHLLALEVLVRSADGVRRILRDGLVPARWRLFGAGELDGMSPERDLRSGGAGFVFARLLTSHRLGAPLPEEIDYALFLDWNVFDLEARFVLREERFGSLHALSEAKSDRELATALAEGRWPAHHEVLFLQDLPARWIMGVQCRTRDAELRLRDLIGPGGPPLWTGSSRRWPPEGP